MPNRRLSQHHADCHSSLYSHFLGRAHQGIRGSVCRYRGAEQDELKTVLQTLLMSRLAGEAITAVESPAGAEIMVSGSYVAFGKIFSLDAVAKPAQVMFSRVLSSRVTIRMN